MKKKIWLTPLITLLLAAGLAMHPGCKTHKEFDITGVWELTRIETYCHFTSKYIFIGTKKEGEIEEYPEDNIHSGGTYRVELNQVFLSTWIGRGPQWNFRDYTGYVISNNFLEGTIAGRSESGGKITLTWTGNWSATR
jgi:hypothetical protein